MDRAAEVLRRIRLHLASGRREATIELLPAELGRLQVKLRLTERRDRLEGVVRVESAETLALLERHAPELRAALGRQGLEVGELRLELGLESRDGRAPRDPAPRAVRPPEVAAPATRLLDRTTAGLAPAGVDTYA